MWIYRVDGKLVGVEENDGHKGTMWQMEYWREQKLKKQIVAREYFSGPKMDFGGLSRPDLNYPVAMTCSNELFQYNTI